MVVFIKKICIIAVPVLLILAFPVFILSISGEFTHPDSVIARQYSGNQVLYAPAYANFENYYKLQQVLKQKANVLALGNSRILDIRQEFFNSGVSFYNAGLLVKGIQNYIPVFSQITHEVQPKVMIIDIEQSQFNYAGLDFDGYYNIEPQFKRPDPWNYILNVTVRAWPLVYRDYFQKKFSLTQLFNDIKNGKKIGLLSTIGDEGYRKDGSYRNGRVIDHPHDPKNYDYNFKDVNYLITDKSGYFRNNQQGISERAVAETNSLLQVAKSRGMYVIAYMPPYAPTVYKKLKSDPNYSYIFQIEDRLKPIFQKYGFDLYNFSDPATFGGIDEEFFDGYHPGERTYAKFFVYMARHNAVLGKLANVDAIENGLKNFKSDYEVFGN